MSALATWLDSHRGAAAVLGGHALVVWGVVGLGSPWGTMSLECAPGAIAGLLLGEGPWPLWDSYDGATGGYMLWAFATLPLFALLGPSGWVPQLAAYAAAAGLVLLVYRLLVRFVGRSSALLAAAGVAFAPPVLFRASLTFGDWHWTQMLFDYGLLFGLLSLGASLRSGPGPGDGPGLAGAPAPRVWLGLGLLSGLGLTNSMGSIPFLAVGWTVGFVVLAPRWSLRALATVGAGAFVGASPFFYKLFLHRPLGLDPPSVEKTVARLSRLHPDVDKLWDLVLGRLPSALHLEAALPSAPAAAVGSAAVVWVLVCWVGLVLALGAASRDRGQGLRLAASVTPCVFVAVFVFAYFVLDVRLPDQDSPFANPRGTADRSLPPLGVALLLASSIGWGRLADHCKGRGNHRLAAIALGVGLLPAAVGGAAQLAIVAAAVDSPGSPSVYRARCHEPMGFFGAPLFLTQPQRLHERCRRLEDPGAARGCLAGAAWGQGFHSGGYRSGVASDGAPGPAPPGIGLTDRAKNACDGFDPALRRACFLGIGWYVGTTDWGRPSWPIPACNDLPAAVDQASCWRGVGFPLGDHLHPMPQRLRAALERVPPGRRPDAARGAGYSLGRTYSSAEHALVLCDALGGEVTGGCRAGVLEAFSER